MLLYLPCPYLYMLHKKKKKREAGAELRLEGLRNEGCN